MMMGKGRRIREQRRRDSAPDLESLVDALRSIESPEQFDRLVDRRPGLFGEAMVGYLRQLAQDPAIERFVGRFQRLIERAHKDPAGGWRAFRDEMAEAERLGREIEPSVSKLEEMMSKRAFDEAIRLGEETLPRALEVGFGLLVGEVHAHLADAFRLRVTGEPGENIDAAIAHTEGALAVAVDPRHRVSLQMNLAVLVASRKNGDPAENFEHGVAVLRDALKQLDGHAPGDLRARVQTNLARTLQGRERGQRLVNLREARDLCTSALQWRSLDRNGEDWAYTKINLGAIVADSAVMGEAELADAERHLLDVIEASDRIGVPGLVGAAQASLGGLCRRAAERIAEEEGRVLIGPGRLPPPGEAETQRLQTARAHLSAALRLLDAESDRDRVGRALDDLGAVDEALGDDDDAIETYRRALTALGPKSTPAECLHAAGRLGWLLAQRGDWEGSAAAYTMAVSASEFGFHVRLETADRFAEAQRAGNLARWAAFALAKAGDANAAVLVLENGRTREIRRRLGLGVDEVRIGELPLDARVDYLQALGDLSVASLGRDSDEAGRRLQGVLTAIRQLPGFEDFAKGASMADVASAIEPDSPLIYVNPTPFGTLVLIVTTSEGRIESAAEFLDSPSSHDVLMALMFGDMSDPSEPDSYLLGASGANDDPRPFRRGLRYVLGALGESVAHPLANRLCELGVTGATIVACGPISQAPLHAAAWSIGEDELSLLDLFDVQFAPSASLHASCLQRARARGDRVPALTAVANPDLGDPKHDLPAAQAEVDEVARHFGPGNVAIAARKDATRGFLAANARAATHLHLACHGKGGLLDPEQAGIALADGWVPATELAGRSLEARLTVVSACQTAVADIAHLPDEAFSLSTAFLAAGSAAVVATLWSIDDAATALLMTRFYGELFDGCEPARALRRAQLWLRDLNEAEQAGFLTEHPALADEFRRRAEQGRSPGLRYSFESNSDTEPGPYAAPEFWAAFVVFGT